MIIDFLLDEYWTSSETKEYVDAAVSGISMDEYWTSAETKDYVDAVENHINSVEEVTSRALNDLNDRVVELSGSTVDLSGYYTSGQTDAAIATQIDEALSGFSSDAHILKGIDDSYDFPEGEVGDLISTYFLSIEDELYGWDITETETPELKNIVIDGSNSTVIDGKILGVIEGVDCHSVLTDEEPTVPNWDGFEFWCGTGMQYGEGDTYRGYWDSVNQTLAFETISAQTPINFQVVETEPNVYEIRNADLPSTDEPIFTINSNIYEYVDTKWVNAIHIEHLGELYITKVNDVSSLNYNEAVKLYDSPYVYTGEENGWVGIPNASEVNDSISRATQNKVSSSTISTIWTGTQADYNLIDTPDPNTFYVITGTTA